MKCFYDETQDAIGICKNCGKGLSREYATDLGTGLACKDKCESEVKRLTALLEHSITLSANSENLTRDSGKTYFASSIFFIGIGLVFLIYGFGPGRTNYMLTLGCLFLAYGAYDFFRARSIFKTKDEKGSGVDSSQ